jgi:hypothetical protein
MQGKYAWKFHEDLNGKPVLQTVDAGIETVFILGPWLDKPISWLLQEIANTEAQIDQCIAEKTKERT